MKLKSLFQGIASISIKGSKEISITGISAHSKYICPGNLFVAKRSQRADAHRFTQEAKEAGAAVILTDMYDPFLKNLTQVIHPDIESIEPLIAERYYQSAHRSLLLVGITGTNGKTTCSYLIKHLLDHLGSPCGLIGTIESIIQDHRYPSGFTTPDLLTNHRFFYEMKTHGCKSAVMEVSSHGLDQGRVEGLEFDVAVFTNLTQDHLDYHQTMERYALAKAKLFSALGQDPQSCKKTLPKYAVVNGDSPATPELLKHCGAEVLTYGIEKPADIRSTDLVLSPEGMQCNIHYKQEVLPFHCQLIGRFNIYNCLAAIGVGISQGYSLTKILKSLESFKKVPGRLERIENGCGLHVFVDYAHTEDALRNVLETLREIKRGRLITIFGCGGDRDQSKRPKMGKVVEALSDLTIVTSDNPRKEDPEAIVKEILQGLQKPHLALVELDRRAAIHRAIGLAKQNDIVLIAGKGHETSQVFAHQTIAFDDRLVAKDALMSIDGNLLEKI